LRLGTVVSKVLRACHAALYDDFLPEETPNRILLPLAEFDPQTHNVAESVFLPQHEILCKLLKDNRAIDNIDRVRAYNGKFQFDAVWATSDDGRVNFAAFAVDIYHWHQLGDAVLGRAQGCLGTYRIRGDAIPEGASIATQVELPYKWKEPLNPFEELGAN
jgi:hypothetical protein